MLGKSKLLIAVTLLEAIHSANADGIYTKNSPVLRLDADSYDRLIFRSNHTSILEFYAPWCGHCQNLKPAYEKAAKKLDGLAKVAAINCDDDANKAFCGQMGVQGFPTLKIVVPSKKVGGKPLVEDYQGPRTVKGIVDAVIEQIPNHIKRLSDKDFDEWLANANETTKAILFTEKGTTSALLRALAIDFLGKIKFAQVRDKVQSAVESFGVAKFPTLILLPGGEQQAIAYDGELKKKPIIDFLSQVAEPNPDPAPEKPKPSKGKLKTQKKPERKTSSSAATGDSATGTIKATEATPDPEPSASERHDKGEERDNEDATSSSPPVESASPVPPKIPPIRVLATSTDIKSTCLSHNAGTCLLLILSLPQIAPEEAPKGVEQALSSLAEIEHKYASSRHSKLFPFYAVVDLVEEVKTLKNELELGSDPVEIIVINAKRGWWRRFDPAEGGGEYGMRELENWVDAIRLGEGQRQKLPEGAIPDKKVEKPEVKTAEEPGLSFEFEPLEDETEQKPEKETQTPPAHEEL